MVDNALYWLWLVYGIEIILAWFVVAFVASLLLPFVRTSRTRYQLATRQALDSLKACWSQCPEAATASFDLFYQSHSFRELAARNRILWEQALAQVMKGVQELTSGVDHLRRALAATDRTLGDFTHALSAHDSSFPKLREVPDTKDLWVELKAVRRAKALLLLAGSIALAIMVVNTGMLSQILKDLDIGLVRVAGQLMLFNIFAFLLTLTEIGLGIMYSTLGEEGRQPSVGTHLGQLVMIVLAAGLAFVEGYFYSHASGEEQVAGLLQIEPRQAFLVLGCALPITLFGLGHICFKALMTIRDGYTLDAMRKDLRRIKQQVDPLQGMFQEIEACLDRGRKLAAEVEQQFAALDQAKRDAVSQVLHQTRQEIREWGQTIPVWAKARLESLSPAECQQQGLRVFAWGIMTLMAVGASVWLHTWALGTQYPELVGPFPTVLALAQAGALLVAGLLIRRSSVVVEDAGGVTFATEAWGYAAWIAVGGVVLLVVVANSGLVSEFPKAVGIAAVLVLALGAGLIPLGRELPSMVSMALCTGLAIGRTVKGTMALIGSWAICTITGGFAVLEFFLGLIAVPAHWVMGPRGSGVGASTVKPQE